MSGIAAEAIEPPYSNETVIADNQIQKYASSEIPIEWIYPDFYDAVEPNTDTATSGICGEALSWQLADDGTLTITGTGVMTDFARVRSPWYANRSKITAVSFPAGITYIGNYAFYDCDNLTTVEIPDTVTAIGMGSFSDCDTLAEVVLGKNLCTIGNSAFYFSDALAAITMPDNLQTIGTYTFGDSIQDVRIPASVTYIPEEILSLSNICAFTSKNETQIGYYTDDCNILFYGREDGTAQLVKCPRNGVKSYVVPDTVTEICAYAFADRGLYEISFPDGLSSIGDYAFDSNTLTRVTLNPSLTAVGIHAFWFNPLDTLTIPDSLTTIGEGAFQPKRIVIPDSVTYVAPYFAQSTRTEAYIVYDTDGVGYFDEDCVLYYADPDTGDILLAAFPSAREITEYSVRPGTKVIGENAFYKNGFLTALHIPASVEEIKTSAPWCRNLQSIYFTGDAPTIHGFPVDVTLYYNIGADGWTAPYWTDADNNRHKTAVLMPDFNGDGTFDYYDITKLYSCFRGKTTLPKDTYTDFDGDGTFGYYDITRLYGIYRDGGVAGNGDNGFDVEPKITTLGTIEYKTTATGTLYYYYAKTNDQPSPDKFLSNWRSAQESGKTDVIRNRTATMTYKTSLSESYPYIVFCIQEGNIYRTPLVLDISFQTGFTIYSISNGKIRLAVDTDGTLRYKQVERDGDSTGYWSSSQSVSKGDIITISYDVNGGRYMALWMDNLPATYIDLSDDYSHNDGSDDGSNTRGSGFRSVERKLNGTTLEVNFTPDVDGTVYFSSSASGSTGQQQSVTAGSQYSMSFDVSAYLKYEGITGGITITMQLTSGSKIYERVTLLDTGK